MPEQRDDLIDTPAAAAILKITPRRLQQLAAEGWVKAAARGKWALVPLVHGYIDSLKDENGRRTKSAADSRVRDARATEIERRMAIQDRELIELSEALATVDDITGAFLGAVSGLPAQIAKDQRERERITEICDGVRSRLDRRFSESREALRSGRPADQADDEDDA